MYSIRKSLIFKDFRLFLYVFGCILVADSGVKLVRRAFFAVTYHRSAADHPVRGGFFLPIFFDNILYFQNSI